MSQMNDKKKIIEVKNLRAGYGFVEVVHDVSFSVGEGEILAILGSNGAGKTSTLRALTGEIKPMGGEILYEGKSIVGVKPYKLAQMGMSMVPEGRHLFGNLSVQDNLLMGAYLIKDQNQLQKNLEEVYKLFPRVKERAKQTARTLSGGEQQMVAIARGMMMNPKVLILDDSTSAVDTATDAKIQAAFREKIPGTTRLIIAQRISSVEHADRILVMHDGCVDGFDTHENLLKTNEIYRDVYESQIKGSGDFDKGGED